MVSGTQVAAVRIQTDGETELPQIRRCRASHAATNNEADFKFDASFDWQPVQSVAQGVSDVTKLWYIEDQPRSGILDRLETLNKKCTRSK